VEGEKGKAIIGPGYLPKKNTELSLKMEFSLCPSRAPCLSCGMERRVVSEKVTRVK